MQQTKQKTRANEILMKKIRDIKLVDEIQKLFARPENFEDIKADIAQRGIQEPLVISKNDELVCGYTRFEAAKELELSELPCRIRQFTDQQSMIEYAILDNINRRQLTDLELAEYGLMLQDVYKERRGKRTDLGTKCPQVKGKTRELVVKRIRDLTGVRMSGRKFERLKKIALSVIPQIKALYIQGSISQTQILKLSNLDFETQKRIVRNFSKRPDISMDKRIDKELEKLTLNKYRRKEAKEYSKEHPNLARWEEALAKGELEKDYRSNFLRANPCKKEFTGQLEHYPRYSGQKISQMDDWNKDNNRVPLFTPEEWKEINEFKRDLDWRELGIIIDWPHEEPLREDPIIRRTYDPNYGNFIVQKSKIKWWKPVPQECPVYIRQGWGVWMKITFNDGEGGRTTRRFFKHDHWLGTLIEEAFNSVHPERFSNDNWRRLNIHRVQKKKMSWWYIKKETGKIDDAIKALEKDLNQLKKKKTWSKREEDIEKRALEWLANYELTSVSASYCREGTQTYKRLPNGNIDKEWMRKKRL